jgi:hypothetical protein
MSEPTQLDAYEFDARNFNPDQGQAAIPGGKYALAISNTENKKTKDGKGVRFVVEFTVMEGPYANAKIWNGYNLINENQEAVRIAHQQLSALCHAVGIYNVSMRNQGAALRGARLQADVVMRVGPEGNTNDVKRVYDANGNEPGKLGGMPMTSPGPQPGYGAPPPNAYPPGPQQAPATWGPPQGQPPQPAGPAPGWAPPQQPQPMQPPPGQPPQQPYQPQPNPAYPPQQQPYPPQGQPPAWPQGQPTQPAQPQTQPAQQGWAPGGAPGQAPSWAAPR